MQTVPDLPASAEPLMRQEAVIMKASRRPDFDLEKLAQAMCDRDQTE